jgi:hypothetical protein
LPTRYSLLSSTGGTDIPIFIIVSDKTPSPEIISDNHKKALDRTPGIGLSDRAKIATVAPIPKANTDGVSLNVVCNILEMAKGEDKAVFCLKAIIAIIISLITVYPIPRNRIINKI